MSEVAEMQHSFTIFEQHSSKRLQYIVLCCKDRECKCQRKFKLLQSKKKKLSSSLLPPFPLPSLLPPPSPSSSSSRFTLNWILENWTEQSRELLGRLLDEWWVIVRSLKIEARSRQWKFLILTILWNKIFLEMRFCSVPGFLFVCFFLHMLHSIIITHNLKDGKTET